MIIYFRKGLVNEWTLPTEPKKKRKMKKTQELLKRPGIVCIKTFSVNISEDFCHSLSLSHIRN